MADAPDRNGVARLLRHWLGPVTIEEFTRLSGGASKRDMVLRRDRAPMAR